jgi:hypothetical protein
MLRALGDRNYNTLPFQIKDFLDEQHWSAYKLIDDLRFEPTGMYRDAYVVRKQEQIPCSVAANGVGLIGLAIADYAGWEKNAAGKAMTTLQTMAHEKGPCRPERDPDTGYFRHWFDIATGECRMNAEFSTVDTALFICGAVFACNYFQDPAMIRLTRKIFHSIDWRAAIADGDSGVFYMSVEDGKGAEPICPFNEYSILAYITAHVHPKGSLLWQNLFRDVRLNRMPIHRRYGKKLLGMPQGIPSSFVYQFPFYLINDYTTSPCYQGILRNIALADKADWRNHDLPPYIWGHGAGVNYQEYYQADTIGNNPTLTVSPYIVAGFLPVYPEGVFDLFRMHEYIQTHGNTSDPLFNHAYKYGLSRFCPGRAWYPRHLAAIDWSSMLYGITAFKWGNEFFSCYNGVTERIYD